MTFTQAPVVTEGEQATSTQCAQQAEAFNTRLLSGVADWAWRVAYYWVNLWRQVRNPASDGLTFPSQLEYFTGYGLLNPDSSTSTWPTADRGDYEGLNLACPGAALVGGNPDVASEVDRFAAVTILSTAATAIQKWNVGIQQRGAIDTAAGVQGSPIADAAEAWQRIAQPTWSPHGKAYGGYLPTPAKVATGAAVEYECGDDEENGAYIVNYAIKFTALSAGVTVPTHYGTQTTVGGVPVITYAGSCPCGTTHSGVGHVVYQWTGPQFYYVVVATAANCGSVAVVRYPFTDWIEGPYTGSGELTHTHGNHLNRVHHRYASEFRGSYEQRATDTFDVEAIGFPFEEFLGSQYLLAPARGTYAGGAITADYPTAGWSSVASITAQDKATWAAGGTSYTAHSGFVLAGFVAQATGLSSTTYLDATVGGSVIGTVTLEPDETGAASGLVYFSAPTDGALEIVDRLGSTFTTTGSIAIEAAELYEAKPNYWDAFAVLRIGSAAEGPQVPGRGVDTTDAADIGARYFANGCALGAAPIEDNEQQINQNPLYDAARRMTNEMVRVLPRQQFVAYEVSGGKSALYLNRYTTISGETIDLLQGIAPSPDALGGNPTVTGETYVVRSDLGTGTATYAGTTYTAGQTFTATDQSVPSVTGDAMVLQYDGIRATALQRGWTNRWCSFVEPRHYNLDPASIWKPSAYSDYWSFCDRCHFYSGSFPRHLIRIMSYDPNVEEDAQGRVTTGINRIQASLYSPECPPGYRYIESSNQWQYETDAARFRKSCRVYEPPLEIESAVMSDHAAGTVKLTFSTRFHSHEDAPSSWSATPPTWADGGAVPAAVTALQNETSDTSTGYRTIDNALRCYHVHQANPHWNPPLAHKGDYGQGSGVTSLPSGQQPYGAVYPVMFFVALCNAPYHDGNDTVEPTDTRMTVDEMQKREVYLRAGCEGWMDSQVTAERVCAENPAGGAYYDEGRIFDFTWESLNFQAHGGRWIGSVGDALREDTPEGFGPLPNTLIYADVFNRISQCVNLLTGARLPVKSELQYRTLTYSDYEARNFTVGSGCRYLLGASAPTASTLTATNDWAVVAATGPFSVPGFTPRHYCTATDTPADGLITTKTEIQLRIRVQSGWEHCIPPDLLAHIEGDYGGFVTRYYEYEGYDTQTTECDWDETDTDGAATCTTLTVGSYVADPPPTGDYFLGTVGDRGTERNVPHSVLLTDQMFIEIPTA